MRFPIILVLGLLSVGLRAQFLGRDTTRVNLALEVSFGKLAESSFNGNMVDQPPAVVPSHKSPFLAAALSLVLPGLGEYYVGDQVWRGAIFTAIDAGLWFGHYTYLGRGDDSTVAFQAYADQYWLPKRYADTLNYFLNTAQIDYRITNPDDFSQINRAEDTLSRYISGFPLSHHLPPRGSQQYYELISKYQQFTHGWIDDVDGIPEHSPRYQRHAQMRANMNYQYEIADDFLFGLIINRALSAIDAVLLAKDHNTPLRLQGELRSVSTPDGGHTFAPTAHLQYRF